jgi:hypothetical protein
MIAEGRGDQRPTREARTPGPQKPRCGGAGCERPAKVKGYCIKHYLRLYHHGDPNYEPGPGQPRQCSIEDCIGMTHAGGLCSRHYQMGRRVDNMIRRMEAELAEARKVALQLRRMSDRAVVNQSERESSL